jgi:glycerol-3-phosphate acyltransferase PlsX
VLEDLNGAHGDPVIAVDAMGGDFAPDEVVRGAVEAQVRGHHVVLVGPSQTVEQCLQDLGARVPVVDAPEVIGMDEGVSKRMLGGRSSLQVAADLVTEHRADAVVSCGNSAAIWTVARFTWGTQPGIDRAAFGGMLPTAHGGVFVLDIGANTSVRATSLVQFAVMGEVYMQVTRGLERPRVALLSNGTEDSKGTKEIKEANETLRRLHDINFIGNVEGNHVFEGAADVVVCDGFTGNVLLKGGEGVAMEIFNLLKTELSKDWVSRLAAAALMPSFSRVKQLVDYEEYGGAPVLGVNGVMVNCHGKSKAKAVCNAIGLAERMVLEDIVDRISGALHHESVEVGSRRRRLARAFHLRHE